MTPRRRFPLRAAALSFVLTAAPGLGSPLRAQQSRTGSGPPTVVQADVLLAIPGMVRDLARDEAGRILYCTGEGRVGRIDPGGSGQGGSGHTLLATAQSAPFPNELRAVAATPGGDIAVLDAQGDIRVLVGGVPPAVLTYGDLFMIRDATDLIVDARGNYLVASSSPSSGQRAINWIQADGARWGYYLVKHQPVQLAHDPWTGGILMADEAGGGNLMLVEPGDGFRTVSAVDVTTHPGLGAAQDDGDMAVDSSGNVYWIAGGTVYERHRASQTTSVRASGLGQLRGVVIARSSGRIPGSRPYSLYVAEGDGPTLLREIPNVGAPGEVRADDQGVVPGRGLPVNVSFGFQAFELTSDNAGNLLVGGSLYRSSFFVKRITLGATPTISTLATNASGLTGTIEGLCVAPDDTIFALTREGSIFRITEGPLSVTKVFSDPFGQIGAGKDLSLDLNGSLYVATRDSWAFGKLLRVSGGSATLLTTTVESRGLAASPGGGLLFSQWNGPGFNGTVDRYRFDDGTTETLPGFEGINFTNDSVWGDGDLCVDVNGSVYTVSEDDWSLVRYSASREGFVRIGSGYLNHPSGLAIAPSTPGVQSATGWSLYVAEFDHLWERPGVPAPASTLVDSSLGFSAERSLACAPHPRFGRPLVLAPLPRTSLPGVGGLIGTAGGWVLAFDGRTGAVRPVAGPDDGLRGRIVALTPRPGGRILALNEDGELFDLSTHGVVPLRARPATIDPEVVTVALRQAREAPRRTLSVPDPLSGMQHWFAIDGWAVWRVGDGR